jgi:homoserine kinase type II
MLNTLKDMKVPHYKYSENNKYIEKFKDGWVTVYDFIPGKSPKKINKEKAFELGKFLGEFHKLSYKFKKEIPTRRKFYDLSHSVIEKMEVVAKKQKNNKLASLVEEIKIGVIKNSPSRNLPVGPIHVDIGHNNELFIGNKLSGIIDFGNFYRGPYMVDIGKTIMWNCCSGGKIDIRLYKSLMSGYNSKRKLNVIESKCIAQSILFAIYSHIWVDLYHVPIRYVPESWPLFLINTFLPAAKNIEKSGLK